MECYYRGVLFGAWFFEIREDYEREIIQAEKYVSSIIDKVYIRSEE